MRRTAWSIPLLAALVLPACGTNNIDVPKEEAQLRRGAYIFQQKCSGCHTLEIAGTEGSAHRANDREYKDGPNFNVRRETYDQVRYAIVNGGYSSGPMPQDIVTGQELDDVARFVATYSGREAERPTSPGKRGTTGGSPASGGPGEEGAQNQSDTD